MRTVITIAAACVTVASAMAQAIYYQDKDNCDMLRHVWQQEPLRKEFVLPDVNGFKVLKADLHTHTVYSDGQTTPDYRVREAWVDGLDVLAIADHVEYRNREGNMISFLKGYIPEGVEAVNNNLVCSEADSRGIIADLNVPYKLAKPVADNYGLTLIQAVEITRDPTTIGHYNALFITDANTIYDADPAESMRKARRQGALIMHNHPGWMRKSLKMTEFEEKVYAENLIDGIEIMNGPEFYPSAVNRAKEKGLFMAANTDIHATTAATYGSQNAQRNMTLILARDNSPEAVKEALKAHRTLAYAYGSLAGDEQLVRELFKACVDISVVKTDSKGRKTVKMTNLTSMTFVLTFGGNPVQLQPFTSRHASVKKGKSLSFTVENLWIPGADSHPHFDIAL